MFPREVLINQHAQIFDNVFALQRNIGVAEEIKNFQIDLIRCFFLSGSNNYELRFFNV